MLGELERITRHAGDRRGAKRLDQLDLQRGRRAVAGSAGHHSGAQLLRGAGIAQADRVDAERKTYMDEVPRPAARRRLQASEPFHRVAHVGRRAGIEQGLSGDAAGTPVFHRRVAPGDAEILVKTFRRQAAQLVLGEDRDTVPFLGIVEPVGVDAVETAREEARQFRALDGDRQALPPDRLDFLARARQRQGVFGLRHVSIPGRRRARGPARAARISGLCRWRSWGGRKTRPSSAP